MLKNLIRNKKLQKGFTIIEVMIVLAIAGLILVVVLIAVPQLQRNQRNEARRSILARISTEIGNYSGNNNGQIPDATDIDGLTARYLSSINIKDPSTDVNVPVVHIASANQGVGSIAEVNLVLGQASYMPGMSCDGESLATGSARSYALWTLFEGGSIYCLDNL